ncbi:MAG: cyclopropane-fatty-acyl-phospholipid synthase family protein [Pseudomonadota bacterium]
MFLEHKLEQWVSSVSKQIALPLRVELWNGKHFDLSQAPPKVIIRIPQASALSYLLTPSLSNLGSAYVDGKIDIVGKPSEIISIGGELASNTLKQEGKFARIKRSLWHSKAKDAEAIRYHYDVSNDFYKLWLDENMLYSCAYFENGDEDLATAQLKKIDHILTKIRVRPGDRLLDIGCGWGALVIRAAQKYGARCVGVTLSENQAALAKQRVLEAGLGDQVEIRLQDYRDVTGTFDRITSVGMFEHVGLLNLRGYFDKIQSLLTEDGLAMNHGITSTDADSGEAPYGGGEFIERYVFPHGELPHISLVLKSMQEGGLEALDVENLRRHYAKTCAIWADNFEQHAQQIQDIAGDKRYRIWRVYLAGCAYAFESDWISLYQVVCTKSGRTLADQPWSRSYMYRKEV